MSFAGLTYLALWLSAKLSISFPYIPSCSIAKDRCQTIFSTGTKPRSTCEPYPAQSLQSSSSLPPLRDQAAAPPIYLLLIPALPVACATYIASTRWVDNRHTGFDIFCGALLGIFFAWLGFRMYNLPLSSGAGWAWGPRNRDRAFFTGTGLRGHAEGEGISSALQPNPHSVSGSALLDRPSGAWADPNRRSFVSAEG